VKGAAPRLAGRSFCLKGKSKKEKGKSQRKNSMSDEQYPVEDKQAGDGKIRIIARFFTFNFYLFPFTFKISP
jgi:hypothetical protein